MKRAITILLALVMVMSLAACGGSKDNVLDKSFSILGKSYSSLDDLKTAIENVYGKPDKVSETESFSSSGKLTPVTVYIYNKIELYGVVGSLTFRLDDKHSKIQSFFWTYQPEGIEKSEYEKKISTIVKKMDARYGKHGDGDDLHQYDWKDNSGLCYSMEVKSDVTWINIKTFGLE